MTRWAAQSKNLVESAKYASCIAGPLCCPISHTHRDKFEFPAYDDLFRSQIDGADTFRNGRPSMCKSFRRTDGLFRSQRGEVYILSSDLVLTQRLFITAHSGAALHGEHEATRLALL